MKGKTGGLLVEWIFLFIQKQIIKKNLKCVKYCIYEQIAVKESDTKILKKN